MSVEKVQNYEKYRSLIDESACVVKFTANWCGPCRVIKPVFQELAEKHGERVSFLEVDIDVAIEITDYEDVKSIPYMVFYVRGSKIDELCFKGERSEVLRENIETFITDYVNKQNNEGAVLVVPESTMPNLSRLTLDEIEESEEDYEEEVEEDPVVEEKTVVEQEGR